MSNQPLAEIRAKRKKLEDDYRREVAALEKEIAESSKVERANAVGQIRQLMEEFNITAEDLSTRKKGQSKSKGTVAVQFRGPNGETWTGRGRQPKWLGDNREQYRV
jgi:DNA-binding protein H-NS